MFAGLCGNCRENIDKVRPWCYNLLCVLMPIFTFFAAITTVVVVLFLPYQGLYSKEWDMVAHDCVSSTYVEFDCFAYFTFVKTTHFRKSAYSFQTDAPRKGTAYENTVPASHTADNGVSLASPACRRCHRRFFHTHGRTSPPISRF